MADKRNPEAGNLGAKNLAAGKPLDHSHVTAGASEPPGMIGRPLTDYTGPEFVAFSEGYASGYVAGIERGRHLADDEAAALWRNAARVIHEMAKIAPRDEVADARRAEERAAWWAERRGERRPA